MRERPTSLIAELTHACPLHCVYCSNPLELVSSSSELSTNEWLRIIEDASELGVVQLHLTGGEPLLRDDLEVLVEAAARKDVYANLITSGLGLDCARANRLASSGLRHVQVSVQANLPDLADAIAGRKAHGAKVAAAEAVRRAGMSLSINVVLHRHNIDRLAEIVDFCASLGPERVELANAQYYGWALVNRAELLPTREQISAAETLLGGLRQKLGDSTELVWVLPDYFESFPKPCMGGWGHSSLTVSPDGRVLPCPVATAIVGLTFDNVRERGLSWIWEHSASFEAFRGYGWMREPCRSCERRFIDLGGCRCQAFLLTGDATRTDPVCQWSPDHALVAAAVAATARPQPASVRRPSSEVFRQFAYRRHPSRALTTVSERAG